MKKASKRPANRITRGIVPTAIASGLLSPVTMGAPGDLDPAFGVMGRVSALQFDGPAWSVQPLSGDQSLFAGGEYCDYYCSYYYGGHDSGFIGELSGVGAVESSSPAELLNSTEVRDTALQTDGKVIAVGRYLAGGHSSSFTVMRFLPDGTLDPTFGDAGVVMAVGGGSGAQAVTLDPSGAIAVAGSNADGNLTVVRLLTSGTFDASFGDGGVFTGPRNDFVATKILRTTGGGYRITTNYADASRECRVVGLTSGGTLDNSFGTAGIAAPATAGGSVGCASMAAQSDGSLLLAGQQDGHGFVERLLPSGAPDASFVASQVPVAMFSATALALDASGNVLVAGSPFSATPGALLVRLQATGALDPLFGSAGSAWIDLDSIQAPAVHDMKVLADGRVLAAGGGPGKAGLPFVVRLLGDAGSPGAGVIGMAATNTSVKEKDQTATVTVRRTGGAAGAVSVAYHTGGPGSTATPGQDYTAVSGQLSWADGDRTDRQITVPITDDAGPAEFSEYIAVTIDAAAGGAALGTSGSLVEILGDGDPAGQFDFDVSTVTVSEADNFVNVYVTRNYYSSGAASVTVTPVAGSATDADVAMAPVTLSWADGETGYKIATFAITRDDGKESDESFTIQLSNPTNGAVIGPVSTQTVTITDPTPVGTTPPSGGGGGGIDWLTLACLGMIRWVLKRAGSGAWIDVKGR